MLIGIDASRATVSQRTGTEGYSLHIIRSLIEQGQGHRFRLYFRDEPDPNLIDPDERVEIQVIRRPRLWTHSGLGPTVRRQRPDVLFVPSHVVPWPNVGGPSVFTAHDLGYRHYPEKHPLPARAYLDWSTRHSANIATRVIAVSHATAHDLTQLNRTPADKIRVVHSGVDPQLQPVTDQGRIHALRDRLGIEGPFVLHVGSLQPRKNLSRLIEAFSQIKDVVPGLTLVLAGRRGWGYQPIFDRISQLRVAERVRVTGYVPDEDLSTLYSAASVYAFPSLYEGFGFPALEAMACGTPVVCSNVSSLPELTGDAALSFAPTDVTGMANALRRVLTDPALHAQLVERGKQRANQFTWEAAGRETLDVLEEAANVMDATLI
jgi:glycosyltransferase involved in cell wall biosynthesis